MRHLYGSYNGQPFEHIDSADKDNPKSTMLREYRMAFGSGWVFEWRARAPR